MQKSAVLIGSLLLLAIMITGIAGGAPQPSQFYGSVSIDGAPAPVGTYISARVDNRECGSALLVKEGNYGQHPGTLDPAFTVFCPEIRENDRIFFSINGYSAEQFWDYSSHGLTRLDLSLNRLENIPPVVNFTADVTQGNAPLVVQFTDQTETSPRSSVWDFGDGSEPAYTRNAVHIFTRPGVYDVKHTASNVTGIAHKEKTGYITIYPAGDMNNNWRIDTDDVMMVVNMSAGNLMPDPAADLNRDGLINESDVIMIRYYHDRE